MNSRIIPVVDLFAGPGGLAEGFSAVSDESGKPCFDVTLSIEKDPSASQTLELRSFFREFPKGGAPDEYYSLLRGEFSREELFQKFPLEASRTNKKVWCAELGSDKLSEVELKRRIREAIGDAEYWVLVGGPPCQAYSIAGRSRNKGVKDYRAENDPRHFLYKEYLRILGTFWPPVFIMENVRGITSSKVNGNFIFEKILADLRAPHDALAGTQGFWKSRRRSHRYYIYSLVKPISSTDLFGTPEFNPNDFIIQSEKYGIPQLRHRLILIGIRDDFSGIKPAVLTKRKEIPAGNVLLGLPRIRSGLSKEDDSPELWLTRLKEVTGCQWFSSSNRKTGDMVLYLMKQVVSVMSSPCHDRGAEFIQFKANVGCEHDWYLDPRIGGVCNNTSRSHMVSDLYRYLYAACFAQIKQVSPKLVDFPPDLRPNHVNVPYSLGHDNFSDRFRVQLYSYPATTITSHLSRDGHYCIHPDPKQCRSLTVREAARIQTFPDNYLFLGSRTAQYVQVGNAVPPFLAKQIAMVVHDVITKARIKY